VLLPALTLPEIVSVAVWPVFVGAVLWLRYRHHRVA
jgi:hypothetical protein